MPLNAWRRFATNRRPREPGFWLCQFCRGAIDTGTTGDDDKTRAWALDAETAPVAPLPSASVLPVPSTAHQLLMRCQALLIQLLHNGWRYQEQSAIGQAELLANDLTAVGFYRLAHVLGQFRNTESEARVEAMNNGVLLCEQLFPMLQQQG